MAKGRLKTLVGRPTEPVPVDTELRFRDLMRTHFRNYCAKSTIHCVRYLYDPKLHNIERFIWGVLLIISITLCCIFYLLVSERFVAQKLQTVVQDPQYPVFYVQFPAVGLCIDNRINWSKLEAAKTHFLPANASADLVKDFTVLVARMETLRFGAYQQRVSEMEDINFESLDFVNITSAALFLSLRCADVIVPNSCQWRRTTFNCCDYFLLEKTEYGFCLVFNSELSPLAQELKLREGIEFYPKHNSKAGQGTGLSFKMVLDNKFKRPNSTATDNIFIMIKKPNQMSSEVYSMTPNTDTYVTVRPEITNTDETTRNMLPEQRNCLFADEQSDEGINDAFKLRNKQFQLTNCLNQCHESYLIKLCNCTLPIFFLYNSLAADCNAASLRCLSRYNDIFSYDKRAEEDAFFSATKAGMTCSCLVSCNLVEYYMDMTTLPLRTDEELQTSQQKLFKVDVHYQIEMVMKYRTSLEFSSIDLIANLGGIFGLCLGASMVSAVELIYYLTVGFALHLYDNSYYSTLRKRVTLNWRRYFSNDVAEVRSSEQQPEMVWQRQLRHPFNHKPNAW